MTQTKKIVFGGKRGYNRQLSIEKSKGWKVESEQIRPVGIRNRNVYIANLTRDN